MKIYRLTQKYFCEAILRWDSRSADVVAESVEDALAEVAAWYLETKEEPLSLENWSACILYEGDKTKLIGWHEN